MTTVDARPDEDQGEWAYGTRLEQPTKALPDPLDLGENDPAEADAETQPRARKPQPQGEPGNRDAERRDGDRPADRRDRSSDDDHEGRKSEASDKSEEPPPPPSKWVFVIAGVIVLGLLAWGVYAHWRRSNEAESTQKNAQSVVPEVRTTQAKSDDKAVDLTLPGQTDALTTANIFARATGYVTERRVDIGSRVKKGDLLLHIAAPDLDQQLAQAIAQVGQVKAAEAQAEAQVTQAEANVNLAKVTLARTSSLTQQGYETLQNRDNQTATLLSQQATLETAKAGVKVAEANTKAQLATVDRLKALTGFEDVIAPFDGVITVRNTDVGALVNADTSGANPLLSIAQDDVVRVTVQVPQNEAVGVRNGLPAKIDVPQLPGQVFRGTVTRSSVALLSSARTLDTEVDIPNPDGHLRPGLFTYVTIDIPRTRPNIVVPAEAIIFNQHGLQVASVEGDKATLHDVKIYRDMGTTVELSEGLKGDEQIILSPPAILKDGEQVKAKPAEDKRPEGGDQPDQQKKDKPDQQGKAAPDQQTMGQNGAEAGQGSDSH